MAYLHGNKQSSCNSQTTDHQHLSMLVPNKQHSSSVIGCHAMCYIAEMSEIQKGSEPARETNQSQQGICICSSFVQP